MMSSPNSVISHTDVSGVKQYVSTHDRRVMPSPPFPYQFLSRLYVKFTDSMIAFNPTLSVSSLPTLL